MATETKEVKFEDGILICCDNLEWSKQQPDNSIDLVFGSPPYEAQRTYGIDFNLMGQDWVDWMVERWKEWDRISKGLVAMVVEGFTEDFKWSATPVLLMADLHRAGFRLRKPPLYRRDGIPGTGNVDWLANKYEFIICTSKGRFPWSNNVAMGHPNLYRAGGMMSNRHKDGQRMNQNGRRAARLKELGIPKGKGYTKPEKANPGNIIDCGAAGGGKMGSDFAHEGEAPFPEYLAEFFIRSFCPENGIVLDPFVGSGTTVAVARKNRRLFIGLDIRQSQIEITTTRLEEARLLQGFDLSKI